MIPQCLACHICTDLWGPRSIAKLAHITPITMAYRTYNELVTGANLNQLITEGGPKLYLAIFVWFISPASCACGKPGARSGLIDTNVLLQFICVSPTHSYLLIGNTFTSSVSIWSSITYWIYIYIYIYDIGFPRDSSMCSKELISEKRVQEFHHVWGVLRVEAN